MHEKIKTALELFLQFRKVKGISVRTLGDYHYHISAFSAKIPANSEDYRTAAFAYLGKDGIANNTHNIRFAYLKAFFSWCIEEGIFTCPHPLKGLKKRKPTSRIINIDNKAISALLDLPDRSTFCGLRDYALLFFSIDTGTRPSESLQLVKGDFDFKLCTARIRAEIAKTRTGRVVPISTQTADAVKMLLSAHRQEWTAAPVFCSQDGTPFTSNYWAKRLKEYETDITPYALRHCAALSLLRGGASAFHVQKILGHSNIGMTEKYISLTMDDLKQAHSKASLINSIMSPTPDRFRQRKIA